MPRYDLTSEPVPSTQPKSSRSIGLHKISALPDRRDQDCHWRWRLQGRYVYQPMSQGERRAGDAGRRILHAGKRVALKNRDQGPKLLWAAV